MATLDFTELTERYAALPDGGGREVGARLLARWREPHRKYHNEDHLRFLLARLDELAGSAADPVAVELAGWFHDAVYDPRGADNEERSAELAEAALPHSARHAEVARLVRLTAGHRPAPGDTNGATLCDADLAVLAGSPEEYAAYAAAVRVEYGHLADSEFAAGRGEVLRQLLARPRLFHTVYGSEHWEPTARFNVSAELALLS
ncbi:metal-dependent phosphohydrolase [Streptomyces sp. 3MP-14]|uniref:Metal-dependent phosphohydrolase n=1 Tax=Streptomyces mimosae TaxID=2586635 RepID=A0A5N5ZSN1_9ACTN|nr:MULTISPECIES: metal-dependent phosphohydrolase [Streptomyces]KAB8158849.1 metal-dependent phosphohydrolase [Streptomyces mimosae]KAB8172751.1 metal-dependent phosphohydrolase [Streptomyces sp. 3MP-14]